MPQTLSPQIVPTVEILEKYINKTASMAEYFSIPEPTGKQDILVESNLTWGQPM